MAEFDCVAAISRQPQLEHLVLPLRQADMLRTPEFQHPVQCLYRDANLIRASSINAGA